MTRRTAVIFALLALAARRSMGQVEPKRTATWLVVDIPTHTPPPVVTTCQSLGPAGTGDFVCTAEARQAYTHALEVRYQDRVVRLTASEIMDALEGK